MRRIFFQGGSPSNDDGYLKGTHQVEPSNTSIIGRTRVTTLLGPEQIFSNVLKLIQNAEKSIQIAVFRFQNFSVDGIPPGPAGNLRAYPKQQQILNALIDKKKTNPNCTIQVILDSCGWLPEEDINNQKIVPYLRKNGIDVLPYPPVTEGGPLCMHDKFIAVDGEKVILGSPGFNSQTAAYYESGILVEKHAPHPHSEVDNIIDKIFNRNWHFAFKKTEELLKGDAKIKKIMAVFRTLMSRDAQEKVRSTHQNYLRSIFPGSEYKKYANLPETNPIANPAFKVLASNPESSAQEELNEIGQYINKRLDTATSMEAEIPIICDKDIVNKIINRQQESLNGGKPFNCRLIISPGALKRYQFIKEAYERLKKSGVSVRPFKTDKSEAQRFHARWAIFDNEEVLVGTPHWEPTGLKNNFRGIYWDTAKQSDNSLQKGNHEIAVTIRDRMTARTFIRQFQKDWEHSHS